MSQTPSAPPATAPSLYPQVQPGYAPPAQGATQAPPPQGYAQTAPPQGYAQTAPPQGAPQGTYPPTGAPQGSYPPTGAPQGAHPPGPTPGYAPPAESTAQGVAKAFDSMVDKVKKVAIGGVTQPKTSIECFKDGNVVSLKSKVSNFLRILADGRVDSRGPDGKDAISQFVVKVVGPGIVTLQSANNQNNFLSLYQGVVNGTGQGGGAFCHFTLVEAPDTAISLSAMGEPGLCVGVTQDGGIADPKHVQPGHHFAQFTAVLIREGIAAIQPASTGPAPGLPAMFALRDGNTIQLISKMSGKPLHIAKNGRLSSSGDYSELCDFLVVQKDPGVLMLRSSTIRSFFLCIYQNETEGRGQGGKFCEVKPSPTPDNYVTFESVKCPGQFVGINNNGVPQRADKMSPIHAETHFRIRIVRVVPSQEQLPVLLRMDGQPSMLNNMRDGIKVQLVSRSFGDTLEIRDNGLVSGKGGSSFNSDFVIVSRGGNIVSFQHSKHKGYMLCVHANSVKGKLGSGAMVDFVVHETFDRHILLESLANPGQFLAVTSSGELKPPNKTNIQDPDCQFYIK